MSSRYKKPDSGNMALSDFGVSVKNPIKIKALSSKTLLLSGSEIRSILWSIAACRGLTYTGHIMKFIEAMTS
jgi:hypothetical protein